MECLSFCVAKKFDLQSLDNYFKNSMQGFASIKTRDVLKLSPLANPEQVLFVFKNGTLVSWGVKRHEVTFYLETLSKLTHKSISVSVHDEFHYQVGNKTAIGPHDYFDVDCLTIEEDTDEIKLALSYGFSQSAKLQYFETIIDALIDKYKPLIRTLSREGEMPVSRKQISQVLGEILGAKSEVNLTSNFLHHPKYFWQHPILEEHYIMLERYLHIQRRIHAINHRLDTLNEIFDMCNVYLQNKHSHLLEIIIIVLIIIEIIVAVLKFHF